jgi:DNA polymerase-3 subunit gamma/tau
MGFIVTARKWRPQRFEDVVGQEHITSTLKNAIKNNRIAHAYMFTGPRGVGKTTTARILAKALNCLNPIDSEPCNACELCLSIQNGQSLDIIEIDGASNRGIDEIRTLRESVKYAPSRGKYKIYIIDEVHMLTKESFNAFLKTLEEPPAHTIFIFATTDIHKVPLTIISRCQRFDFRRIQLHTIKTLLNEIASKENIEIDDKTLTIIARKADGALRDAESFFDQVVSFCGNKIDTETVSKLLNLIDDEVYFNISDAILAKDFNAVFRVSNLIYDNGYDFVDFTNGLIEHFRNILTVILTQNTNQVETAEIYRPKYIEYIGKFSEGDLLRILNFLNKTQQELRFTQNHRLKIEISLSHLIGFERTVTIGELLTRFDSSEGHSLREPEKKNYTIPIVNIPAVKSTTSKPLSPSPKAISSQDSNEQGASAAEFIPGNQAVYKENQDNSNKKKYSIKDKSQTVPLNHNAGNLFETIVNNWSGFVKAVVTEKRMMLGPYIGLVELIGLEGAALKVYLGDEDGKKQFILYKDYIAKKSAEIFGKKLEFHFESHPIPLGSSERKQVTYPNGEELNDDPLVDLIKKELGGEEMSG